MIGLAWFLLIGNTINNRYLIGRCLVTSNLKEVVMKKSSIKVMLSVLVIVAMLVAVTGPVMAGPTGKVNINKASVSELTTLNKVGEKYAERIVEYRKKNGAFKKPEDIMNVKGIGIKIYEVNKNVIVVK